MPPAFTHDNDAAMVRAFANTIRRIVDSRHCFGNEHVLQVGAYVVQWAEQLADIIERDDEDARRDFDGEAETPIREVPTQIGIIRKVRS